MQLGALCPALILPPLWSSYKQVTGACAGSGRQGCPPSGWGVFPTVPAQRLWPGELCMSVCRITNCLHDLAHREISQPRWWVYKHCLLVVLGAFAGNRPHQARAAPNTRLGSEPTALARILALKQPHSSSCLSRASRGQAPPPRAGVRGFEQHGGQSGGCSPGRGPIPGLSPLQPTGPPPPQSGPPGSAAARPSPQA